MGWYGPQTGGCSCCECDYCSDPPDTFKVALANLANGFCDDCGPFDGTYFCDYLGRYGFTFCDGAAGTHIADACYWRSECQEDIRASDGGCTAVSARMLVAIGEKSGLYYVETRILIFLAVSSDCSYQYDSSHVGFSNRYGTKPDCSAFNNTAMGAFAKCNGGPAFVQCQYDSYTTMNLTAV